MLRPRATGTVVEGQVVWRDMVPPDGTEVTADLPWPDATSLADDPAAPGPFAGLLELAGTPRDCPADCVEQADQSGPNSKLRQKLLLLGCIALHHERPGLEPRSGGSP